MSASFCDHLLCYIHCMKLLISALCVLVMKQCQASDLRYPAYTASELLKCLVWFCLYNKNISVCVCVYRKLCQYWLNKLNFLIISSPGIIILTYVMVLVNLHQEMRRKGSVLIHRLQNSLSWNRSRHPRFLGSLFSITTGGSTMFPRRFSSDPDFLYLYLPW